MIIENETQKILKADAEPEWKFSNGGEQTRNLRLVQETPVEKSGLDNVENIKRTRGPPVVDLSDWESGDDDEVKNFQVF